MEHEHRHLHSKTSTAMLRTAADRTYVAKTGKPTERTFALHSHTRSYKIPPTHPPAATAALGARNGDGDGDDDGVPGCAAAAPRERLAGAGARSPLPPHPSLGLPSRRPPRVPPRQRLRHPRHRCLVYPGYSALAALIDALPSLEIVASFSVGIDHVDLPKCRERGIRVTNTPDVLTDDVADLAVGLAIAALRRIPQADRFVRAGLWKAKGDYALTTRLSGKRVGIIGLGRIGLAIANRVKAFDCPVNYYQRTKKDYANYIYYPSVVELAANSDVLVVACPLSDQTRHIVNREVIEALGPKGVLINIGRGPHVDEHELVSALVEGRLGGAGLDVFEDEPSVPESLFTLENVVLVPHMGSGTHETREAMADLVLGNLQAHVRKKPLLTPVI